jgi:hypothetical protein
MEAPQREGARRSAHGTWKKNSESVYREPWAVRL